jgi:hypothetical protein
VADDGTPEIGARRAGCCPSVTTKPILLIESQSFGPALEALPLGRSGLCL